MYWKVLFTLAFIPKVISLNPDLIDFVSDYVSYKDLRHVCYFTCESHYSSLVVTQRLNKQRCRVSVRRIDMHIDWWRIVQQRTAYVGFVLDGACEPAPRVLLQASQNKVFKSVHPWLILTDSYNTNNDSVTEYIYDNFHRLNLSVDADVTVVGHNGENFTLFDVFNYGKIQENPLEIVKIGTWNDATRLDINQKGYKYYNRWDFHNLTLRAISVIVDQPKVFYPELLSEEGYTAGVAAMTKITSNLLNTLKQIHNFRFNYTIAGRWIGTPEKNSILGVTNALFWEQQDISSTCARIFPNWLDWVDIYHPKITDLQTKFYYLIPDRGVGDYENRFLTPLSPGVWCCALFAGVACTLVLAATAFMESRPKPGLYAFFSVAAAFCQQAYEDGVQLVEETFNSQGRRLTLLVIGLTSMLLYNYYTSSVVSWLLNAAAPSIDNLDGLINSDLELVFEDIGYTRGWLDNPGFYYYSGYKNLKEDELREKKVTNAKRTASVLQTVDSGVQLIRTGRYAFHTEPYTASQVISKIYEDEELCNMGTLQMMQPAHVYVMTQKQSPYKEFFDWSLLRLMERGHIHAIKAKFADTMPACSGQRPRALSLGQAAPAFLLLFQLTILSWVILLFEVFCKRFQQKYHGQWSLMGKKWCQQIGQMTSHNVNPRVNVKKIIE